MNFKYILALIIVVNLKAFYSISQEVNFVQFDGYVVSDEGRISDATLSVNEEGGASPVVTVKTNEKGEFKIKFDYNKQYKVKVFKDGYVYKYILVDTDMPASYTGEVGFGFPIELFETCKGVDLSNMEKPVVKITFNARVNDFEPDNNYARDMFLKILDIKQKITECKDKEYNDIIDEAEVLTEEKKYDDAISKYEEALEMRPKEKDPEKQIANINKLKKNQGEEAKEDLTNDFDKYIDIAENHYSNEEYEKAIEEYKKALAINPSDAYVKSRMNKAKKEIEKQNQEALIAKEAAEQKAKEEAERKAAELAAQKEKERIAAEEVSRKAKEAAELKAKQEEERKAAELAAQEEKERIAAQKAKEAAELKAKQEEERKAAELASQKEKERIAAQVAEQKAKEAAELKVKQEEERKAAELAAQKEKERIAAELAAKKSKEEADRKAAELAAKEAAEKKVLEEKKAQETAYNEALRNGDNYLNSKKLEEAKKEYEKALEIFPEKIYPSTKLDDINALLAKQKQKDEVDEKYKSVIANASQMFQAKKYDEAKRLYNSALSIKPNENYPKAKIKEIEALLTAQRAPVQREKVSGLTALPTLNFKDKKEEEVYLKKLLVQYPSGITVEVYKQSNKTIKRYIIIRDNIATEFREITENWGGKEYRRNGKPITQMYFRNQTAKRDGEYYKVISQ